VEEELLTSEIADRQVGKDDGDILPICRLITAKEGELKPILLATFRFQISGEIPPFRLITRMIIQISWKLEIVRLCGLRLQAMRCINL
jgi:hypothetical protein